MSMLEHPDVTWGQQTGYATFQRGENRDTPESRAEYIDAYQEELLKWLKDAYTEILDEFSDYAPRYGAQTYDSWLN